MTSGQIKKKFSAASARANTSASRVKSSSFPAMFAPIADSGSTGMGIPGTKATPSEDCGSPDRPPVTSPRIKLGDGRHLAYREAGVPKEEAKYMAMTAPKELIEELKIFFLSFDIDPNPTRLVKSEAYDVQELADKLQIDSKFYVIRISMGAYLVYNCLKYTPHNRKRFDSKVFMEFNPVNLVNPFPDYEGLLHVWQGYEDRIRPSLVNRSLRKASLDSLS